MLPRYFGVNLAIFELFLPVGLAIFCSHFATFGILIRYPLRRLVVISPPWELKFPGPRSQMYEKKRGTYIMLTAMGRWMQTDDCQSDMHIRLYVQSKVHTKYSVWYAYQTVQLRNTFEAHSMGLCPRTECPPESEQFPFSARVTRLINHNHNQIENPVNRPGFSKNPVSWVTGFSGQIGPNSRVLVCIHHWVWLENTVSVLWNPVRNPVKTRLVPIVY